MTEQTEYVVLNQDASGLWAVVSGGSVRAPSAGTAIRHKALTHPNLEVMVAVPVRSWQPVKVGRVEKVQLTFEAAP